MTTYSITNGWKRGRRWFLHSSFTHSHIQACMHLFIRHCLGMYVRHCPSAGTQRWKWSQPQVHYAGRQACNRPTLASILQNCAELPKMTQTSYTPVKSSFGGVYIWARLPSINRYSSGEWGDVYGPEGRGRGISKHEAQRPEPAKHGQALHQRPFWLKST